MPYYRRGYRRRYRLGRRYRRRLYRRSYARRYVNASSRSSIRCKCVVTGQSTLHSGYGSTLGSDVFAILPFTEPSLTTAALTSSPLFGAYVNLYEEMKLIGMKVQVSVTDQIGGATLPSLQIYTAWDRRHGYGEPNLTPTQIKESASNNIATALNNNVAKLTRSIYASDLIEKAQWIDSTLSGSLDVRSWYTAGVNPNMFCPSLFMCFASPSLSQASEVASVHFSVSVTYYVAFRNPRFGGSGSTRELPAKSVTFADEPDDDMDDGVQADLARLDEYRYNPDADEPAGAAQAAAASLNDPAPLGRRQRSTASQAAGDQPRQKVQKNIQG